MEQQKKILVSSIITYGNLGRYTSQIRLNRTAKHLLGHLSSQLLSQKVLSEVCLKSYCVSWLLSSVWKTALEPTAQVIRKML